MQEDIVARAVWNPLTKEEEDAVHLESIKILEHVGIKVTSQQVLRMLKKVRGLSLSSEKPIGEEWRIAKPLLCSNPSIFNHLFVFTPQR